MHPSNAPNLPDFYGVERHHGVPNNDTGCTQTSPLNVRICFQFTTAAGNLQRRERQPQGTIPSVFLDENDILE